MIKLVASVVAAAIASLLLLFLLLGLVVRLPAQQVMVMALLPSSPWGRVLRARPPGMTPNTATATSSSSSSTRERW